MLIQKYKEEWKHDFQDIKKIIQNALKGLDTRIEHIGSTAVPGLAAKPIIDIDIVFYDDDAFSKIKARLLKIGYFHNGDQGIPSREAFKRKDPVTKHPVLDVIKHHLYACPNDSPELNRHLLFRDYLLKNDWAKKEYQNLKYQLAEATNHNRKAYALLKEIKAKAFILSIIDLAKKQNEEKVE